MVHEDGAADGAAHHGPHGDRGRPHQGVRSGRRRRSRGFANFRETATKTNSLVDRLRKLTLPAVDDVRKGLEIYTETVEHAEELEAKVERTDDLTDKIVYELYGLTDEEVDIVEETVAD
ncbi:BREX-1 system adenine-specific DNA-methyltransferase PglX [Halobacterium sp. KA-6]|nr:BREX-1 system adenine-specific DNA-methyltransferase PglX [Halobacterium sp. KA-6]MCD2204016.1 BREX-1 system adenine-specific DNA-methyltransferase PglX [Halobacterium sp. KA-6]